MTNNRAVLASLYSTFERELFGGDRLASREFACVMNPGQFVSPALSEESADDMQIQHDLTDRALDTSFAYRELPASISQTYREVLEFKALPRRTSSASEEREIETIRRWMKERDGDYTLYRDRYYDVVDAHGIEASREHPDASRLLRLARKRDDALQDWNRRGFKRDWENRQARMNYLLMGSPATWFDDLNLKLSRHQRESPTGISYYQTHFTPKASEWLAPGTSWTEYSSEVDDVSSTSQARSTSWSGGLSAGWGLWSFGVNASGSTERRHETSSTSNLRVKFEFLRVRIVRPWFVPDVFSHRFWTWKQAHGFTPVSDGGSVHAGVPTRPIGQMPFVPTHFFLVRNVELAAAYSRTDSEFVQSQFQSNASFGWGPFSISGSYSEKNTTHRFKGTFENGSIRIEHPQIIAFSGLLLPKTPDPIRTLPWEEDAVFSEGIGEDALKFRREQMLGDYVRARLEAAGTDRRNAALEYLDIESASADGAEEHEGTAMRADLAAALDLRMATRR